MGACSCTGNSAVLYDPSEVEIKERPRGLESSASSAEQPRRVILKSLGTMDLLVEDHSRRGSCDSNQLDSCSASTWEGDDMSPISGAEFVRSQSDLEPEQEPERDACPASVAAVLLQPSPRAQQPGRPNFSGPWLCTRVEGDWNAYLKETGVSWAARTAAAGLGFGVGKQTQDIIQTASHLEVLNVVQCLPPRQATAVYRTDGAEETVVDLEGHPTRSSTSWQGGVLVTEQCPVGSRPKPLPTVRRFMEGDEMCTERITASGLVVKRFYTRR